MNKCSDGELAEYKALHTNVLAVAKTRRAGTMWLVYIKNVPGEKHSVEWPEVAAYGDEQIEGLARVLFPFFPRNVKEVTGKTPRYGS